MTTINIHLTIFLGIRHLVATLQQSQQLANVNVRFGFHYLQRNQVLGYLNSKVLELGLFNEKNKTRFVQNLQLIH